MVGLEDAVARVEIGELGVEARGSTEMELAMAEGAASWMKDEAGKDAEKDDDVADAEGGPCD